MYAESLIRRPSQALPIVLEGLTRMEYRGYDSAGVAVVSPIPLIKGASLRGGVVAELLHNLLPKTAVLL